MDIMNVETRRIKLGRKIQELVSPFMLYIVYITSTTREVVHELLLKSKILNNYTLLHAIAWTFN